MVSVSSLAQQQKPCFLAYNKNNQPVQTICVGQRISFRDNTGQGKVPEAYDFDDRDGLDFTQADTVFTFTTPGRFTVTQLRGIGNICPRVIEVKAAAPAAPPVLQKLTLQSTGILLQLQSSAVNELVVEQATSPSGPFTEVGRIAAAPAGQSEHTITVATVTGCFRLRVTNVCTGEETIVSNVVCAQDLQVTAADRQNQLNWNINQSGAASYQIFRNGQLYQTVPNSQTSFTDTQVACGRSYTYQLVAQFPNSSQSASLARQVETLGTTPPAPPFLVASFNAQNQVVLNTNNPAQESFKTQTIYRSLAGGVFALISENQPKNALDASLQNFNSPVCYQTTYLDSCNLTSPRSNTACPALLVATLQADGSVQLTWNAYEGFPGGSPTQTLELLDEQGTVYWTTPVTGQAFTDVQPQQKFQRLRYRLKTEAPTGDFQSFSNTVTLDQPFQFYFPTAFSPNNDGLNDLFKALGSQFATSFSLQVLNRWGQIIFEAKDPTQGWDGTYNGKPAPPETYLYRLQAVDVQGQKITKSGTVTLVR
nr:gliding motility-associated C-terminal domain-containing protein [Rufibacter sp. LB8]